MTKPIAIVINETLHIKRLVHHHFGFLSEWEMDVLLWLFVKNEPLALSELFERMPCTIALRAIELLAQKELVIVIASENGFTLGLADLTRDQLAVSYLDG
jgi:predicted transcriptional regulator